MYSRQASFTAHICLHSWRPYWRVVGMSMLRVAILIVLSVAACTVAPAPTASLAVTSAPSPSSTSLIQPTAAASPDWAKLETALDLPVVGPGAACPRASGRVVSPDFGLALGDGPVYPVGLGTAGILGVVAADRGGFMQKVLWVASSAYPGPVLIRGGRLGAAGAIHFGTGDTLPGDEFRLTGGTASSAGEEPGWRAWPSYTYVPSLGCYAYQIDGVGFTKIVVFEASST